MSVMADSVRMEYRIVPAVKPLDTKQKKDKNFKRNPVTEDPDNKIYSLQPLFKAPKSTRDVKSLKEASKDEATIKKVSERNGYNSNFNHFTMSRPGLIKSPETLVTSPHNDFCAASRQNKTPAEISQTSPTNTRTKFRNGDVSPYCRQTINGQTEETEISSRYRHSAASSHRRASAGDERQSLSASSQYRGRMSIPNITVTSPVISAAASKYSESNSQGASPRQTNESSNRRRASSGKEIQVKFKQNDGQEGPRRKSLYDGRVTQPWYSLERRPVSTERCERSRRNVISPTTLSRLSLNQVEMGERGGSASLSVCTEEDWKTYGSKFPNRRLVSHKRLNHKCSLPYNDNIGLEETVTSDQARKAAKMKLYKEWKNKHKPAYQTPKQVWYRTVRSILAANHLYHQVQKKNRKRAEQRQ